MRVVTSDTGASGGYKQKRITRIGGILRRFRLDELPQLINIFRGDMRFVGPRPPLRRYVEMFPDIYGDVLRERPGVTGFATLLYYKTEESLLARCMSPEETETVYCDVCIPKKAYLDLNYATRRSVTTDILLMLATVFKKIDIGAFVSLPDQIGR